MTPMTVDTYHLIVMWLLMMMVMMGIMIVSRNLMVMGQIMGIVAALM
jgi:cell shape-determining protein MreD